MNSKFLSYCFFLVCISWLSSCSANEAHNASIAVKVESGDSISKIADRYKCSAKEKGILFKKHGDRIRVGEVLYIKCGPAKGNKSQQWLINTQDIDSLYSGNPNQRILNLKSAKISGKPPEYIRLHVKGIMGEVFFQDMSLEQDYLKGSISTEFYPSLVELCNGDGQCTDNIYRDSRGPVYPVPAHPVPAHPVPAHPVPAHQVPAHPVPAHQVPAHQVPAHPVPAHPVPAHPVPVHPQQQALGADECLVGQGQVVLKNGKPAINARVTLLIPNVSGFEHRSIRDSGNVLAETVSQNSGLFNLNKVVDSDFVYSILVEPHEGGYKDIEIDFTNGCVKKFIRVVVAN